MVATSSRILSCGVWLMLMRKMSAPASNSLRIIALSEEAGPRVARILIRRSRLMAWSRALRLAAGPTRPGGAHLETQHLEAQHFAEQNLEAQNLAARHSEVACCRWAGPERCRSAPPFPAGLARAAAPAARWRRSIAQSRPS